MNDAAAVQLCLGSGGGCAQHTAVARLLEVRTRTIRSSGRRPLLGLAELQPAHCEQSSQLPTLMFLGGRHSSAEIPCADLLSYLPALLAARGHTVFVLRYRSSFASSAADAHTLLQGQGLRKTLSDVASAIALITEENPQRRIALVGHSSGGKLAYLAAGITNAVVGVASLDGWIFDPSPGRRRSARDELERQIARDQLSGKTVALFPFAEPHLRDRVVGAIASGTADRSEGEQPAGLLKACEAMLASANSTVGRQISSLPNRTQLVDALRFLLTCDRYWPILHMHDSWRMMMAEPAAWDAMAPRSSTKGKRLLSVVAGERGEIFDERAEATLMHFDSAESQQSRMDGAGHLDLICGPATTSRVADCVSTWLMNS